MVTDQPTVSSPEAMEDVMVGNCSYSSGML